MTNTIRMVALVVWVLVILTSLAAWAFFDRDPSGLTPVVAWVSAGLAVGEASNVGKRATWKVEAHEADQIRSDR